LVNDMFTKHEGRTWDMAKELCVSETALKIRMGIPY